MKHIAVEMSTEELHKVWEAYHTLQNFLDKVLSPNELYQAEFVHGLEESLHDVQHGNVTEVQSFDDFIISRSLSCRCHEGLSYDFFL